MQVSKRVGISASGLSIKYIQQNKFDNAELFELETKPMNSNVVPMSSKHIRKNTAEYWKWKLEQSQRIIQESHEKSLKLSEIPGFFKIDKVKLKAASTYRVIQVHGSMEAKDVLKLVEGIKEDKIRKEKAKIEKEKLKQQSREAFYQCKLK